VPAKKLFLAISAFFVSLHGCQQIPAGMVRIPAGEFTMGSDAAQTSNLPTNVSMGSDPNPALFSARPAHRVYLDSFFLDRSTVSIRDYLTFIKAQGISIPPGWTGANPEGGNDENPVVWVNLDEAKGYCRSIGKRLPTEEEWEKAARGTDGRIYPWGSRFEIDRKDTSGPFGTHDMAGRVWEWTDSWFRPYPDAPSRTSLYWKGLRVIRGGGAREPQPELMFRSDYRGFARAERRARDIGFRCAQDAGT